MILGKKINIEDANQNIHFISKGPTINTISPNTVDFEKNTQNNTLAACNGYGLEVSLYTISLFFDEAEQYSLYLSLGNMDMYLGVDLERGVGIKGSISGVELGYDGRIIDASIQGLTLGIGLLYSNGKPEFESGFGWFGFSISINFAELINIISNTN